LWRWSRTRLADPLDWLETETDPGGFSSTISVDGIDVNAEAFYGTVRSDDIHSESGSVGRGNHGADGTGGGKTHPDGFDDL
jgi:hypothetical protein